MLDVVLAADSNPAGSMTGDKPMYQPLLEDSNTLHNGIKAAVSECNLQDKCILSVGAAESGSYNKVQRKLVIACVLCFIFMIVEVVGGYLARSVAIMSDAAHMLSDVSAFLVSIFAAWAATQPSSWHYSFGYHRAEILGALVSVLTIWAVTGALVFEAVQRTINPVRVDGKLMFIVSAAGVCFNIMIALALGVHAHLGHSHSHDSGHSHCHGSHDTKHANAKHDHHHDHGHDHAHGCSANSRCGSHSHKHSSQGCHDHDRTSSGPKHSHNHNHSSSSSNPSTAADDGTSQPLLGDQQAAPSGGAADAQDCLIIDLPAPALAGGSAVSGQCTIARTSSHEIQVRCELPTPAMKQGAAAARPSSRCSTGHGGHSHCHGHGDAGSINLRSAVLHVIGDLLQSVGVACAGALIWYNQDDPRWYLADPICTFIFSIVVLLTTRSILIDIVHVLMERTPVNMDIPAMSQVLSDMEGVHDVHDLHIWNISTSTSPVLTAHVHIGPEADANLVLQKLEQYVRSIGIQHSTIQICNPLQAPA